MRWLPALGLLALSVLLTAAAPASSPPDPLAAVDDPVLQALQSELSRARELLGKEEEPPYYIALEAVEVQAVHIQGEEGGLQGWRPQRSRYVHADVRLGEPRLDSSHPLRDGSDDGSPPGREMGIGDDPAVLRREIWREIDDRYRAARERMQRVRSDQQVLVEEELTWDLVPQEPASGLFPRAQLADLDIAAWEDVVRTASAVFAESDVTHDASVQLAAEAETRWFVSTEGHRIRHGDTRYRIAVLGDALAPDGTALQIYRAFDARSPDRLPGIGEVEAAAREVQQLLRELRDAPEEEPYRGPAILSGRAAAVFFHEIFGHRVEGERLKTVDDAQTFRTRVGQFILPPFLSVVDDPSLERLAGQDLRGFYRFDDQGVPAERVTLVDRGKLRGFLESRAPVGKDARSNAHGRRQAGQEVFTRQGNLVVEAASDKVVSAAALRQKLIDAAKAEGLDHGLLIEDIEGGFTFTSRDIPNAFQIDAVVARRVFVDGRRDELVRGIDLIGTPLQTFSRIVAAGDDPSVFNGTCGAESGWVPVSASAPSLLVSQIETQRKSKGQGRQPLVPPPSGTEPIARTGDGDLLLDALVEWSQRSVEDFQIPGAPKAAWAVIAVDDDDSYSAVADFGVLRRELGYPSRPARVELVLGDHELSSSRIDGGWAASLPDSVRKPRFVVDDVWPALLRDLWISSDDSYKAAIQRLMFKRVARSAAPGEPPPPDWSEAEPVVAVDLSPPGEPDRELLRRIATEASARLRSVPGLRTARVTAQSTHGRQYLVSTEGVRIVAPQGHVTVYAFADIVRPDGVRVFDRLQWVVKDEKDLPDLVEIANAVEDMGFSVARRAESPAVSWYEGPVLFEGEAAADLFRYLVPPQVQGTPPEPEAGRSWEDLTRSGPRLGRHLLPRGWSVVDDPASVPQGLAGGYQYDREGVAAQRVELVEDGIVKDLLMTRVPRADLRASNGHARGDVQGPWVSRMSSWSVAPRRLLSAPAMKQAGRAAQRRAGGEPMLVVRRLEQGWEGSLPRPTDAVWRFLDGRELPVLALEFEGVDRRTLQGLAAAGGGMQTWAYLAPLGGGDRAGTTDGLPSVVRCPRQVLIEDLEAVFPGASEERTVLPPPPLEALAP